jgi:phosphohistidine swiveling domain-containing protein
MKPYLPVKKNLPFPGGKFALFTMREDCIARTEMWMTWATDHGLKDYINIPHGSVYEYYWGEKSHMDFLSRVAKKMFSGWAAHLRNYPLKKKAMIDAAGRLESCNDRKKLLSCYNDFLEKSYSFCDYVWGPWGSIYLFEPEIAEKYPEDVASILGLEEPIEFMNMQKDMLKLGNKELVRRYDWQNVYNPYDKPYTEKDFEHMKKELNRSEVEQQHRHFVEVKKEFSALLRKLKGSERKKVEIVHKHVWLKTDRIDTWKKAMANAIPFFEMMADELGISLKEATSMLAYEMVDYLSKGKRPDKKSLAMRVNGKVLYYFKDRRIFLIDKGIEGWRNKLENLKDIKSVSGTIACKGKVTGEAKIISSVEDLEKIEEGDIFVAKFTYPNFTPYMLRAAAIVTDDGGLTSHAAVIAREFRKPCIVGTKHGTKIFKDGDMIEVDANKGIVRKI